MRAWDLALGLSLTTVVFDKICLIEIHTTPSTFYSAIFREIWGLFSIKTFLVSWRALLLTEWKSLEMYLFLIICAGCCNIYYNLCFMFLHRYIFNVNVICWGWENHFVRALFNEGTFLRTNIGYIKCLLFYYWQHIFSSLFFLFRLI